ncbi:hypothetical protein [Roseobacter weihaiensis]|uniref:hypothetical protein n=1 Tax=Roseobacter weihaiensis TaxID=2763262 RepID=UPI001D0A8FE5|nr:hypothetical protein [Roseobacter sp. H9]
MIYWLIYATPEDVYSFEQNAKWATIVNVAARRSLAVGRNAIVAPFDAFDARYVVRDAVKSPCSAQALYLGEIGPKGLEREQTTAAQLGLTSGGAPMFLITVDADRARLYQNYETDGQSTYFLALGDVPALSEDLGWLQACLQEVKRLALFHGPKINSRRIRQKWKFDYELERKYTFAHVLRAATWSTAPVSIWAISRALHDAARSDVLPGWISEFNDQFHLWHYDSEIFEVTDPPAAQGYLAFIPQTDGNTTLKYKRFQEDAELRYESIAHHLPVQPDRYAQKALEVSGGTTRRLPGFRRTRFDVDVESLETGNAFAIVVDISRPFDGSNALLSQSEVEYIRTRSVADPKDVLADFETVCAFAESVFRSCGASYVQTPYSKLSFLRDVHQPSVPEVQAV